MSDRIFLLGGHDLEMQAIRELLDKLRIRYADKKLGWGNALLSEYRDILDEYAGKPDCTIYGIELKEDVPPPSNYVRIDHHNDFIDRPSSIEQVLSVLEYHPGPSPTIGRCQRRKVYPRNAGTRRDTSGGG